MAIAGYQLRNVTADRVDMPGLRQAGDVVDLDYPPFFIDRVEDALPPGSQAPQIPATRKGTTPAAAGEIRSNPCTRLMV
jgi:hypothetical protein